MSDTENQNSTDEQRRNLIADAILSSEAFMWLMVGSDHPKSQADCLREAWRQWQLAGGKSWGKR